MRNVSCLKCGKKFRKLEYECKRTKTHLCSLKCRSQWFKDSDVKIRRPCGFCGKPAIRPRKDFKLSKSGFIFCNHPCAAKYNNAHKKTGVRRSKLERFIEAKLMEQYPSLEILYNQRDAINSELDIYIPSLKFAIELNGIFHYEPIYGPEKLANTQNNDDRKFQACAKAGISLCVIDVSMQKVFSPRTSLKFLSIIISIINQTVKQRKAEYSKLTPVKVPIA